MLSDRSSTIARVEEEGDALSLTWEDGHRSRFHFMWLRDHCPSIFDANTKQRSTSHLHIPRSIAPAQVGRQHAPAPKQIAMAALHVPLKERPQTSTLRTCAAE